MDDVARMSTGDRRDLFNSVAEQRGDMTPLIIEKDFWVCWCLRVIYSEGFPVNMLFKGGTSLSKAYGLIRRFSEDVDLSLNRVELGFLDKREPSNEAISGKQAQRLLVELQATCEKYIRGSLLPSFRHAVEMLLGSADDASWSVKIDDSDPQTVLFSYPPVTKPGGYIPQVLRLEIGARSDHWPHEERTIQSYASETLPEQFTLPQCIVRVLSAERTFWEKATLLHAMHFRPLDKPLQGRMSRHYYDLAMIATTETGQKAFARTDLLNAVARHKNVFYKAGWARYDLATPGTLRLVPPQERIVELQRDYAAMSEMFFGDHPQPLESIMATLQRLEDQINVV